LVRDDWIDLDGEWELRFDDDDLGVDQGWWRPGSAFDRTIRVPYPPESELSGIEEDGHSVVWYRRQAALTAPAEDGRLLLHFGAVDFQADVWVNGIHLGDHEGGHVGFSFDATHALVDGGAQTIVVRAFDDPSALDQPRGKQDWEPEPHVIWYRRTTGIWRQVWAEYVPEISLSRLRWTPGTQPGMVTIDAEVVGRGAGASGLELELVFRLDQTLLGSSRHALVGGRLSTALQLRDPRFTTEPERLQWSPENPILVDVEVRLLRDGSELDSARSYLGVRSTAVDEQSFLLNGRPYFLRLVLEQAFWPESHLAAPDDEAIRREVQLVKELGFNGIRMHQTVADPRFLYWCDHLGLLVWADAPAAYVFSPVAVERTAREWMELVRRDASHPCIVTWVAFNESWGVPDLAVDDAQRNAVRGLTALLKSLDPSRSVVGNDGWEYVAGDLLGIHDYSQSGAELDERYGTRSAVADTVEAVRPGGHVLSVDPARGDRRLPVVLSEFGGVSFGQPESWNGYGRVDGDAGFVARLEQLIGAASRSRALAGFCYTQLTDTLQEANGLADETRTPKVDAEVIRSIVSGDRDGS
jgi:beta-galactosidase/beta-glucuronidase